MTQPLAYAEQISELYFKLSAAEKELDNLKAKLAVAVEALEYFAIDGKFIPRSYFKDGKPSRYDYGERARKALKAINGGE